MILLSVKLKLSPFKYKLEYQGIINTKNRLEFNLKYQDLFQIESPTNDGYNLSPARRPLTTRGGKKRIGEKRRNFGFKKTAKTVQPVSILLRIVRTFSSKK